MPPPSNTANGSSVRHDADVVIDLDAERCRRRRTVQRVGQLPPYWPASCVATWQHFRTLGLTSALTYEVLDEIARGGAA